MVSTFPQSLGMVSCGFALCLGLTNVTRADEYRSYDPCAEIPGNQPDPVKCGKKVEQGIHTITGEVLHQMGGHIGPGSRIEAKVNEIEGEKHVLSINPVR
jgi:hypothetical protein